jgi:hypothetical protein
MLAAPNEGKRLEAAVSETPTSPNQPINEDDPEGERKREGQEDAPGGVQRIVRVLERLIGASDHVDFIGLVASAGIDNVELREWPICDSPRGHAVQLSKARASRF